LPLFFVTDYFRLHSIAAYTRFILDLYRAQPLNGFAWLHGLKAGRGRKQQTVFFMSDLWFLKVGAKLLPASRDKLRFVISLVLEERKSKSLIHRFLPLPIWLLRTCKSFLVRQHRHKGMNAKR